ncbi:recombination directionality factor [Noviherbaspirillum album]|jgi:hypothetical protein|nr:hypothetical protein [Noviherbaspirillum sp. CPCC 100848]
MSTSVSAIKGITIVQPVIGRIMMGHTEVRAGGKCVPQKDDHFTITTLVQKDDRSWEKHPINDVLQPPAPQSRARAAAAQAAAANQTAQQTLNSIPVKIAYNNPALNLHSSYSAFDSKTGRVMCTSDGETARRATSEGIATMACPRPEACEFGRRNRCKNMSRFYVQIDGQDDELGTFILRSTSWNSLTAISARLAMLHGLTGGRLAGLPVMLQLKVKTTTMSFRQPIYFADLVFRPGMTMTQAIEAARTFQKERAQSGLSQEGLEQALAAGLLNGDFAEQVEDIDEWLSDEDLAARAEDNLKSTGLRGLDSVRSATSATTTQVAGAVQPAATVAIQQQGFALSA